VDNSDRAYFKAMKADPSLKSYVTEPVQNRGTGTWTIFLARRVDGPNGEFLGLVLGAIELSYFEDFYQAISTGKGGSATLERLDGATLGPTAPVRPFRIRGASCTEARREHCGRSAP
jgi:hypothetical protein